MSFEKLINVLPKERLQSINIEKDLKMKRNINISNLLKLAIDAQIQRQRNTIENKNIFIKNQLNIKKKLKNIFNIYILYK